MDFLTLKLLSSPLLPPLSLLLLGILGLLLGARRPAGLALLIAALGSLFVLSVPAAGTALAGMLERPYEGRSVHWEGMQAIVILGGGSYAAAPEFGADTVSAATLARLRWGARLHRLSGLPIMVSGGSPRGTAVSEAAQMKAALEQDFRVSVRWTEGSALNTWENARYAKLLLARDNIQRIVLVTHAVHMQRARLEFERAGFSVAAAPTAFSTLHPPGLLNFLPCPEGLELSHAFVHELIGLGWYHVRGLGRVR